MKKTLIALLTMILVLLTSCSEYTDTVESPDNPNVFHLSSLPDIGGFSGFSSGEYFNEFVSDEFVPSTEYGKIIPYIGSYRVFETPESDDWHTEMGYCSFGFCTPDGRIVMKANDKNSYLSVRETDDGFVFYTVTRETIPKEDAPDEYWPTEIYIIPLDGSWCLRFGGNSWVSNAGGGYISVCEYPEDGNVVRTDLYDYDGNLVRTIEGVDSVGVYKNGLIRTAVWSNENGYQTQFIDDEDNIVFGPYKNAIDFNDYGVALVEDEYGAYLINSDGNMLTVYYESIFSEQTENGKTKVFSATHKENDEMIDVLDEMGNYIGTVKGTSYFSLRSPENGELYYYYTEYDVNDKGYPIYDTERLVYKRVSDGTDFVSKEFGLLPNSYMSSDNCYVHIDKNKKGYFFDGNGDTIAVIDEIDEVNCVSEYGEYIVYTTGVYSYDFDEETGDDIITDTRKTHIYDSKKKEIIYTFDIGASAYFPDSNGRFILITVNDSNDFFGGTTNNSLFDTKTGKLLFEDSKQISIYPFNDEMYICVCTENMSAVYDQDMKIIRKSYFE